MRKVESGRLRGRRLAALPRGVTVRPTAAKVRSAVFDRLQDHVAGARVLDLFAGSGGLSIEALSRGASHATLVERDRTMVRFLKRQLEGLGLSAVTRIHCDDALRFLGRRSSRGGGIDKGTDSGQTRETPSLFDLVLFDPPYDSGDLLSRALERLIEGPWLDPSAVIVCERAQLGPEPKAVPVPRGLTLVTTRHYGQTVLDFLAVSPSIPFAEQPGS